MDCCARIGPVDWVSQGLGVMDGGIGHNGFLDQLGLPVHFHMVFISIMGFVGLFCPPGVYVLLPEFRFVPRLLPLIRNLTLLNLLILFSGVPLLWLVHE